MYNLKKDRRMKRNKHIGSNFHGFLKENNTHKKIKGIENVQYTNTFSNNLNNCPNYSLFCI